jgi:titin
MKQKSVGLTLRAFIIALALILVAGSPALPPFDGVAYAQSPVTTLSHLPVPGTSNLQLDWTAVDNADSYRLWKAEGLVTTVAGWGNAPHMTFDDGATIQYVDTDVTVGTTYSYVLEAYEGDTRLGYSNVLEIIGTAKPTAQPDVDLEPMGLDAIKVSWTQVPTATHYRVRYWTSGLSGWMDLDDDATGLTLTHENLEAGRQYYYIVRGENSGGDGPYSGSPGNYDSLTLEGTTTVPELELTRVARTTVDLSWTSTGVDMQYDLERRKVHVAAGVTDGTETEGSWSRLPSGLLTARTYRDEAANYVPTDAVSVKYEYRVRSQDSGGVTGDWSATKSVNIPKAGAILDAPTGLGASPLSASHLRVTWSPVAGADFYQLQWKSGDRSYSAPIRVNSPDSGNPFYDHTNLSASTTYTYQVRSVDINGASDWSAAANGTTRSVQAAAGQMPKVTGLTVTDATEDNDANGRMAKLTWTPVSDATHYEIQRYDPDTTAGWGALGSTAGTTVGSVTRIDATASPSHTDDFAGITLTAADGPAGKTFFYVVSAVEDGVDNDVTVAADNEMGEWSDHKSVTFKAHKPNPPPLTPAESAPSAVKTSGTSILVSWTAPATDDTSGAATAYTVRWRTGDSDTWRNMAASGTSYHHTNLRGNTSYYYRVRAENSGGESEFVDIVQNATGGVTLGNTLTAPTGLTAVDATTSMGPGIKLSWTAVPGASGYEVQRFGAGTNNDAWGDLSDSAGTPEGTAFTAEDSMSVTNGGDDGFSSSGIPLSASTTYLYRVRTVKESAKSAWSATVSGTTKATTPAPPTLVATSTGMSMIRLNWNGVAGATSYEIQWLEGIYDATAFGVANLNRVTISPISGTHRTYVHTGRKAGTRYSYRIRALLAQGGETEWQTPVQQYTKPAKPALSASSSISTTIELAWDAVPFVTDATPTAAGHLTDPGNYVVQRRLENTSTWVTLTTAVACDVATNKCTLSDAGAEITPTAGLSASTRYYYRIRATVTRTTVYTSYWDYEHQNTSN